MTAAQAPSAPALPEAGPAGPAGPPWLGFGRLVRAEWTKIRSVRSTLWSLLAFVVVAFGFSSLVAAVIAHDWNAAGDHPNHLRLLTDPTEVIFGAGFGLGQLAMCVLGVMVITSEYTTGAIRSSLLAAPKRIPMLAAKAVVFTALDLAASAVTVFAVFFTSTAILRSHVSVTLGQPGVLTATIGGILYLGVLGLFALAIGGLIRHTVGALAIVLGMVIVVPPLVSLIPGTIANHVHGYLPTVAGQLVAQTTQQPGDVLSGWQGFGVFCAWTAVLLAACGWLLARRDA
ncbi:MAG TPA: ABC transporter permease [Streptosporangiaceae bacterium]|jgi:ABC-2 type transport system permease protein|nr:ABC transporter permease [Streptosporangiaceae bacterium]